MGVISCTFRPHYPGWVPETVDDVDRAKLTLSQSGVEPVQPSCCTDSDHRIVLLSLITGFIRLEN